MGFREGQVQRFISQYIVTALWSETDGPEQCPEPLDSQGFDRSDLSPDLLAELEVDCRAFLDSYYPLVAEAVKRRGYEIGSAGHDFLLTRNGHGAGFWDRGLGQLGDKLAEAARSFGGTTWYVGDDHMIHGCG
ncbi:hypothetical protein OG474_30550 [Kribbella sp. NBC_01505]|uniref:hypothetical protein n=1 Tax=Kribbella sp. NBC_01505 TaxID=2903580 RepID=UPI00386420B7